VGVVDVIVAASGWALMLSTPGLRTRRTLVFLATMTAAFVAVGYVSDTGTASLVRIVLIGMYALVFFAFQPYLRRRSSVDTEIDARLRRAIEEVTTAHRQWDEAYRRGDLGAARTARLLTARACADAIGEIDALTDAPPNWSLALRLLRDYFVAFQATTKGLDDPGANGGPSTTKSVVALNSEAVTAWEEALKRADAG
jgi:hypothetical protein